MGARILVVEDEPAIREGLRDLLEGSGYAVDLHADGRSGLETALAGGYDLILLDLMLPRLGGLSLCRKLREGGIAVPILMLTAKGTEEDKVRGLKTGADDYLTKPFGVKELLARVEALLRRTTVPERIVFDGITVDLDARRLEREGRTESLTEMEADLLAYLYRNRDRTVSRTELLEKVWRLPGDVATRTVDMHVARLRAKIESDPEQPKHLRSLRGSGYRLETGGER